MLTKLLTHNGLLISAGALVTLATTVKQFLPPHATVAGHICDVIIGLGATLGVASSAATNKVVRDS